MNYELQNLIIRAEQLGLEANIFSLNDKITKRIIKVFEQQDSWLRIDFLGYQKAKLLVHNDVILFGSRKNLTLSMISFLDAQLSPHMKLICLELAQKEIIHDLKTPLFALKNLINYDQFDTPTFNENLNLVLDLSIKILTNKNMDSCKLSILVNQVVRFYMKTHPKVFFSVEISELDVIVERVDECFRLISNIISNALRYSDNNIVKVSLHKCNTKWKLQISNKISFAYNSDGLGYGGYIIAKLSNKNNFTFDVTVRDGEWVASLAGDAS